MYETEVSSTTHVATWYVQFFSEINLKPSQNSKAPWNICELLLKGIFFQVNLSLNELRLQRKGENLQ